VVMLTHIGFPITFTGDQRRMIDLIKKLLLLPLACLVFGACGSPSTNSVTADSNANATKPAVDRAVEEKALRETDLAWSAAAGKRDVDATIAFMADDGVTMSPNVPLSKGKEAIKKDWQGLLGLKDGTISWEPTVVQVAESGEMGFTSGTWKMSWSDDKKGKVEDHGKYLELWKKSGVKWLCYHDMYSSDQAAPAPAK
jgi:ketosteroid isomerase-like protein